VEAGAGAPATEAAAAAGAPTPSPAKEPLLVYERTGSFYNAWYRKRKVFLDKLVPRAEQEAILSQMEGLFKKQGHLVAYIHGPAGTGKSMLGVFLAQRLKGCLCNTLRPWQPGNTLAELYAEADISETKPLVLAMDEFDVALLNIHEGIESHKNLPILIQDKPGWNRFLDEIGRGMYPHVILLLTSNKPPEFIRQLDPSYIRAGRVDMTELLE
jgi:hypothetical protein